MEDTPKKLNSSVHSTPTRPLGVLRTYSSKHASQSLKDDPITSSPRHYHQESPEGPSSASASPETSNKKDFTFGEYEQKLQSFAYMLNPDRKIRRKTEISAQHSSEMITASIKSGEITLKSSVPESYTVKELIHKVKRKLPIMNTTFFQMFIDSRMLTPETVLRDLKKGDSPELSLEYRESFEPLHSLKERELQPIDWDKVGMNVLNFPSDTLFVYSEPINSRVAISPDLLKADSDSLEPYLRECVHFYTRPCKIVRNRLQMFGNKSKVVNLIPLSVDSQRDNASYGSASPPGSSVTYYSPNRSMIINKGDNSAQRFSAIPTFDRLSGDSGKTHTSGDDLGAKLESVTSKKEVTIFAVDNGGLAPFKPADLEPFRTNIFQCFPVGDKDLNPGVLIPTQCYVDKLPEWMMMMESFRLDFGQMGNIEPLFFSFSFHNIKTRQKITEDFEIIPDAFASFFDSNSNMETTQNPLSPSKSEDNGSISRASMSPTSPELRRIPSSGVRKSAEFGQIHKKIPIFAFPAATQGEFPDVNLVVKVFKLLKQTASDKEHKIYMKPEHSKKEIDSLRQLIPDLLESHKSHPTLVPFLWAAVPIFDEKSQLRGSTVNPALGIKQQNPGFFQVTNPLGQTLISPLGPDENLGKKPTALRRFDTELRIVKPGMPFSFEAIYEALESEAQLRKYKPIQGKLFIDLRRLLSEPKMKFQLNPSLQLIVHNEAPTTQNVPVVQIPSTANHADPHVSTPVKVSVDTPSTTAPSLTSTPLNNSLPPSGLSETIAQEIQFFSHSNSDSDPYVSYVNNLYLYPESLSNVKVGSDSNVQIKIQIKANDHKSDGENLFYERFFPKFSSNQWTTISRSKSPQFSDEIKIKLPLSLSPSYHVIFTVYNVSMKKGNKILYFLGQAVLPLFPNRQIVKNDRFELPLTTPELPESGYLNNENIKWSKKKKLVLRIRTESSVYPQSRALQIFFNSWHNPTENTAVLAGIDALHHIDENSTVRFLPIILNVLLSVIGREPPVPAANSVIEDYSRQAKSAFMALVGILKRVDGPQYGQLLQSYASHTFDNNKRPIYDRLLSNWQILWESQDKPMVKDLLEGFKSHWFLFHLMYKSIAISLEENGELYNSQSRFSRKKNSATAVSFVQNLMNFVPKLLQHTTQRLDYEITVAIALALNNFMYFVDCGSIFKIVADYTAMVGISDIPSYFIKTTLLKVVFDHEQYIPLNFTTDVSLEIPSLQASDAIDTFWRKHFLSGLLLNEISNALKNNKDPKFRDQAITVLRNLLYKHELDPRYADPKVKCYIAGIYFPFVLTLVENFKTFEASVTQELELQKWLLCFLFIVKNLKKRHLRQWWKRETQNGKDMFLQLVSLCFTTLADKNRFVEVNFIVLDVLVYFVDFEKILNREEKNPLTDRIFLIIKQLLSSQSELFISALYSALTTVVLKIRKPLFVHTRTNYAQDLIYEIIRHCNIPNQLIRNRAVCLLFLMMKVAYQEKGTINHIRHFATLAISRFVGVAAKNYAMLTKSLVAIIEYCQEKTSGRDTTSETEMVSPLTELSTSPSLGEDDPTEMSSLSMFTTATPSLKAVPLSFYTQASDTISRLIEITNNEKRISSFWQDEERSTELYVNIAHGYSDSPDLKLTWLENLAVTHVEKGNTEEAAQCKIYTAFLICQYLYKVQPLLLPFELRTKEPYPFQRITPYAFDEPGFPDDIFGEEGRFESNLWSQSGMIKMLQEAETLLERDRKYELCMEIMHVLMMIYKHDKSFSAMISWAEKCQNLAQELVKITKEGKQVFSRYYRVTFYGKAFQENDHKCFIYKKRYKLQVGDVATLLKKQISHSLGVDEKLVETLPNKEIDPSTLDPNKTLFQIVAVLPYFQDERASQSDRNFDLRQFISEIPFMSDGGKIDESDVGKLQKKKTIFTIAKPFPYLTSRSPVVKVEDIILSPIESAIEALQKRVNDFRAEVYCSPIRKNNLQSLLLGTVAPSVNVGPMKFCEVFLNPNSSYPANFKEQLRETMGELILFAKNAIRINAGIIGQDQLSFHDMLEEKFTNMYTTFENKFEGGSVWEKVKATLEQKKQESMQETKEQERKLQNPQAKNV